MYPFLLALLYLLACPLLAESKPTNPTNPSTPPAPPRRNYDCLEYSSMVSVNQVDCATALQQILNADKAHAPMLISRTFGFTVPHTWKAGSCAVSIDTSDDRSVTLRLTGVVEAALHIMSHCLDDPPDGTTGLGGSATVGSQSDSGGALEIYINGAEPRPILPPTFPPGRILGLHPGVKIVPHLQ